MDMLWTTLGFLLITGLAVHHHLRHTAKSSEGSAMLPTCPRC
jgi:hypothetical protein